MYRRVVLDGEYRKKVRQLIASGAFKIGESGKLEPANPKGTLNSPWVFTNNDARRKFCTHWNNIYCGHFNLIPTFCRFNCWKTVVYPRNVYELFRLAGLLRTLNLPSKCGADRRNYTYKAWGGYIYGDTLEEGRKYYAEIKKGLSYVIPDMPVILKRGCTEMERLLPSDKWDDHSDEEKALEFQLDDLFHFSEFNFKQSAWVVRDTKEGWIYRAIEIADPTVEQTLAEFGNGVTLDDLIVKSVTYHEEPKEEKPKL